MTAATELIKNISPDYALRLMAEESSELSQAALKVIRAANDETPMSMGEARENLVEEVADVLVMICILKLMLFTEIEAYDIEQTMDRKFDRFTDRLMEKAKKDPA